MDIMDLDEWYIDVSEEEFEDEESQPIYHISNYPADLTLRGYYDKFKSGQLVIPEFQRNYVWDQRKASKLIESFMLGLPVPGVFLYKVRGTNKLSIVDGQQRIMSAIRFFSNRFDEKIFRLSGVLPKWKNKTYDELDESDRFLLDDTVLRATVIQQLDPEDDSSIYHIFERLNTGGINLNSMEIRRCVYHGRFAELLQNLNELPAWRLIVGKPKEDKRLRDVELILRILALQYKWNVYEKPMKNFLNSFIAQINKLSDDQASVFFDRASTSFIKTVSYIVDKLGEKPFHIRGPLNFAVLDSVYVAIANSERLNEDIHLTYQLLLKDREYAAAVSVSTSDDKSIKLRITKAFEILGG
ncbi:DUF262 domain-containing protein [Pseudomonas alliivorans]|nr:DUF262 domain-containing protein [Pseudomonas alliivorans]MEE4971307.1 DUF262 domain-containing protein [Pseudomonas alliivorans]MEE4976896.1 DUF262 domain-containing protein [Pseudomonas alliivorans]MEE4981640.1 DUF262 domain-containing protein [Pseudomonas alliivorans]MEE5004183.1 DUF262 domain-containing protein [Pseudomonas alliivorans]